MNDIEVQCFQQSDLTAVHELIQRTIDSCYSGAYPPRAVEYFKSLNTAEAIINRSESGKTFTAHRQTTIVGTGSVSENEIFAVFVSLDAQRMGVGRALMACLERTVKTDEFKHSSLSVSLPSRKFYESLGYDQFQEQALDVGHGQSLLYWSAVKQLDTGSTSSQC